MLSSKEPSRRVCVAHNYHKHGFKDVAQNQ